MSRILSLTTSIGYMTPRLANNLENEHKTGSIIVFNILNVLGYIPFIGGIPVAIFRFLIAREIIKKKEANKTFLPIFVLRGIIELIGLGFFLLFLDVPFTIFREGYLVYKISQKKEE